MFLWLGVVWGHGRGHLVLGKACSYKGWCKKMAENSNFWFLNTLKLIYFGPGFSQFVLSSCQYVSLGPQRGDWVCWGPCPSASILIINVPWVYKYCICDFIYILANFWRLCTSPQFHRWIFFSLVHHRCGEFLQYLTLIEGSSGLTIWHSPMLPSVLFPGGNPPAEPGGSSMNGT